MVTYISLCNFTDQGIRNIKDSVNRAEMVMGAAAKFGARMTQLFWTQGQYDLVAIIEAPDEASATAFGLSIASGGNVRLQTLRAYNKNEMGGIIAKLP